MELLKTIHNALMYVIPIATLMILAYGVPQIWEYIKNKSSERFGKLNGYSFLFIIFAVIAPITIWYEYVTAIPDGTYCFYVEVKSSSGEYVLPAEICVYTDVYVDEDPNYNTVETPYKVFKLMRFYWPNGGYCEFDDEINEDTFTSVYTWDEDYKVRLTDERAQHPEINEDIEDKNIIPQIVVTIAAIISFSIYWFQYKNSQKK